MINNFKEGDRVRDDMGLVGTIIEIHLDTDQVFVLMDEAGDIISYASNKLHVW